MGPSRPVKNTAPRRPRPRNPNGHQGQQARIQRNRVMDKIPVFVGIDVAKHRLEVHLRPSGESFTINHGEEEVTALVERLGALEPTLIVLEATGGLEVRLAAALAAAALPVAVVNPRQVRSFARATGRLAKTDRLDAKAIAHFAEAVRPPMRPRWPTRRPAACKPWSPAGGSCSRCWWPSATGARPPSPPCTCGSTPISAGWKRLWPKSRATSTGWSGTARSGAPRKSCSARCRASDP